MPPQVSEQEREDVRASPVLVLFWDYALVLHFSLPYTRGHVGVVQVCIMLHSGSRGLGHQVAEVRAYRRGHPMVWKNRVPQAVVDAFEAEGFIWGGRWKHYDTMHFEYRPELLSPACR